MAVTVVVAEMMMILAAVVVAVLVPLPFLLLEIFVGFVQALVFSMLTLVFLTGATTSHRGEAHA